MAHKERWHLAVTTNSCIFSHKTEHGHALIATGASHVQVQPL